ncbi:unnamed protein product [Heligmosomoides polygyrus]|uniref:RAD51_interact domain-containing protein n=1 Tax=Heligmosomoides polygyrus TaxID=6339 RepID=A0A3P7XGZ3_HELPZ|nr:unnamed protein product [Heligmosomoides polygyrus]
MEEESVRSDASHEGSPELYDERDDRQQEYSLQGEESAHRVPEMDEEDVLEMSVLAAQIESAEDFNLTFETVDTSALDEEQVRPKSRQLKKKPSPLHKSDAEDIEEFLEEGLNQSSSTSSEEITNVSIADSLLVEWGSPDRSHLSSAQRKPREDAVEDVIKTSTPKTRGPLKVLTPLFSNGKTTMTSKKRSSTSSNEDDLCSPARKKQPSTPAEKSSSRARSASQSSATFKTPSRPSVKSAVRSAPKQPLKTQNK